MEIFFITLSKRNEIYKQGLENIFLFAEFLFDAE